MVVKVKPPIWMSTSHQSACHQDPVSLAMQFPGRQEAMAQVLGSLPFLMQACGESVSGPKVFFSFISNLLAFSLQLNTIFRKFNSTDIY